MNMVLKRHSLAANSTPKVFFDTKVSDLTNLYNLDRHGDPWPHPVSGDTLQQIKKGKIPMTRDRKRPIDPMEQ
jgi:hypothetical protein